MPRHISKELFELIYCKVIFPLKFREMSTKYMCGLLLISTTAPRILKYSAKNEFLHLRSGVAKPALYLLYRQIIGDLGTPCDKLKVTEQGGAWNKPGQGYNSWSLLAGILSYSYARV